MRCFKTDPAPQGPDTPLKEKPLGDSSVVLLWFCIRGYCILPKELHRSLQVDRKPVSTGLFGRYVWEWIWFYLIQWESFKLVWPSYLALMQSVNFVFLGGWTTADFEAGPCNLRAFN